MEESTKTNLPLEEQRVMQRTTRPATVATEFITLLPIEDLINDQANHISQLRRKREIGKRTDVANPVLAALFYCYETKKAGAIGPFFLDGFPSCFSKAFQGSLSVNNS